MRSGGACMPHKFRGMLSTAMVHHVPPCQHESVMHAASALTIPFLLLSNHWQGQSLTRADFDAAEVHGVIKPAQGPVRAAW